MKLATRDNNTRDGELIIVDKAGQNACLATDIAPNLQTALDNWSELSMKLTQRYNDLCQKNLTNTFQVDTNSLLAPLPRAYEWIDGSAYINHIILVRKARGAEPPETLNTDPLVYQGGSGKLLGPNADIEHFDTTGGIDFESEITVITDDVPMGTKKSDAAGNIKLIMLANDVSLRNIIPDELKKGFGFFVSKPATAFSPFAITPDELGQSWDGGRVYLPLKTTYNGKPFGNPNSGPEMHFSFLDLIQHVTQTRSLTAGTIIGSGTVSNKDQSKGSSCLAEKRMLEKIEKGEITTPFMSFGDTVEIEMLDNEGNSIFGKIAQKVVEKRD